MEIPSITCIYCNQSDQKVPLLSFTFHGSPYWICPEHLPILIHHPAQLAGSLPGVEQQTPAEGHS